VLFAGVLVGTTPLEGAQIPAAQGELLLRKEGHADTTFPLGSGGSAVRLGEVTLARKRAATVRRGPAAPRVAAQAGATITINASFEGDQVVAEVFVDGVKRGQTPLPLNDVSPGQHRVVVRYGASSRTKTITVPRAGDIAISIDIWR
jgi:hypothetical protein